METSTDLGATTGGYEGLVARSGAHVALQVEDTTPWNIEAGQEGQRKGWSSHLGDNQLSGYVIYLDSRSLTRECIGNLLKVRLKDLEIKTISSCSARKSDELDLSRVRAVIINSGAERISSSVVSELVDEAATHFPDTPRILLSDHEDLDSISQAFALGIKGYIPTSLTSLAVAAVVRLVCVGGSFAPTAALLQQSRPPATASHADVISQGADGATVHFTQRQMEILDCLHHGLSNKLIAHRLSMSENTVKVHIRAIMKRLHATNRTQAVCLTRGVLRQLSTGFAT